MAETSNKPCDLPFLPSIFLLFGLGVLRVWVRARLLPLQGLVAIERPGNDGELEMHRDHKAATIKAEQISHQRCEDEACCQDVDGLRELLDDVSPDEPDHAEQHHDDAAEVLGAGLAVKVLERTRNASSC